MLLCDKQKFKEFNLICFFFLCCPGVDGGIVDLGSSIDLHLIHGEPDNSEIWRRLLDASYDISQMNMRNRNTAALIELIRDLNYWWKYLICNKSKYTKYWFYCRLPILQFSGYHCMGKNVTQKLRKSSYILKKFYVKWWET